MDRRALTIGAVFGMLGVAIGAFGAHGLKELLIANDRLDVFETAVRYQFYHAFALLIVGVLAEKLQGLWVNRATLCFTLGVAIFSGSLYTLSITNVGWLGAITPVGGVLIIVGWIYLILGIVKSDQM